jgi:hypothetical protein
MGLHGRLTKEDCLVISYDFATDAYAVKKFREAHPDIPPYILWRAKESAEKWEKNVGVDYKGNEYSLLAKDIEQTNKS